MISPKSPPRTRRQMLAVHTFSPPTPSTTPPDTPGSTTSPKPVLRPKRKPYVEDLANATRELVVGFQKKIADLSAELEDTRDALSQARKLKIQPVESPTSPTSLFFEPGDPEALLRLREDLKKLRSQNAHLARALRQREQHEVQVMDELSKERFTRKQAESEVMRLSTDNFTLLEHNRLLAGRDAALQNDLSLLKFRSSEVGHSRGSSMPVNSPDANKYHARHTSTIDVGFESHAQSRALVVSAQDQLHVAERRLFAAESKNSVLTSRISQLQKNMTLCVDQSADALEVERRLRTDIEERLARVEAERHQAVSQLNIEKPFADAWRRKVNELRNIEALSRRASRCLKDLALESNFIKSPTDASFRHHQRRDSEQPSILTSSYKSRSASFTFPSSSDIPSADSKKSQQDSSILALTLSRRTRINMTLKSKSSVFVDTVHSYTSETHIGS